MTKVLFICHGNICRSTMAEFVFRDMVDRAGLGGQISCASAATSREEIGNGVHCGTARVLSELGIGGYHRKRAVQMTAADGKSYDYLVCMDQNNIKNAKRILKAEDHAKLSLLMSFAGSDKEVADPWYTGNFDATKQDVLAGCEALLEHIVKKQ